MHDLEPDDELQEKIDLFIELKKQQQVARLELDMIEDRQRFVEMYLAEEFSLRGIQNIKMRDGITLYQQLDTKVSVISDKKEEARLVAKELGIEELLVLQPMSLKSYVKELLSDEDGPSFPEYDEEGNELPHTKIPKKLLSILNIHEEMRVRIRGVK